MINIAVDGPAGAGKSTISRAAAKKLGFIYVDTGALYRTVALQVMRNYIEFEEIEKISALLSETDISLRFEDNEQKVILNGEDVSDFIRTSAVSMGASRVSAIPKVREFLFELQQKIARENNCVMDGRDIGTVVLPNAQLKVFLTASAEERARRRCKELIEKGEEVSFDEVLKDIEQRDYNDSHRDIAPLKQADDAVLLDTSDLNLEESIQALTQLIQDIM